MYNFDWILNLVKIAGSKATILFLACITCFFFDKYGLFQLNDEYLQFIFIFAALSASAITIQFFVWLYREKIKPHIRKNDQKKQAKRDLQYLTEHDKLIVAYLLHHNIRTIFCLQTGERAKNLVHMGYMKISMRGNIAYDYDRLPFVVHDIAWEVFQENKELFPYKNNKRNIEPWKNESEYASIFKI
jgi:hypothetical protein